MSRISLVFFIFKKVSNYFSDHQIFSPHFILDIEREGNN